MAADDKLVLLRSTFDRIMAVVKAVEKINGNGVTYKPGVGITISPRMPKAAGAVQQGGGDSSALVKLSGVNRTGGSFYQAYKTTRTTGVIDTSAAPAASDIATATSEEITFQNLNEENQATHALTESPMQFHFIRAFPAGRVDSGGFAVWEANIVTVTDDCTP